MRQRSLKQDKNDWNEFRHHRDRLEGSVSNEFLQDMPLFWTAEGASVPLRGLMRGACAFLCCNGPSFAAIDKRPLNYAYTMSVNNGIAACYERFTPSAWMSVDDPSRFLLSAWINPRVTKYIPHAHANKQVWSSMGGEIKPALKHDGKPLLVRDCPNVLFFHRNEKFMANRFLIEDTVNWGNHSDTTDEFGHKGSRSVMLAAIKIMFQLGFRKIFIVGADFKMAADYKYSFDEIREKGAVNCNNNSYRALNDRFKAILPYAESYGLEIYNCTENSGLTAFPALTYEKALEMNFDWCGGDYRNLTNGHEKTSGMYVDPKLKQQKLVDGIINK